MYENFYRFRQKPFSISPDPEFLYLNDNYKEALALLQYGIEDRKGIVCLIGEVGTGKTMLLHKLLDTIDEHVIPVVVPYSHLSFEDLLDHIMTTLKVDEPSKNITARINALKNYLISESTKGNRIALLVDEAQNMDNQILESLRLFSNIETSQEKLLYIILLGQPELRDKLNLRELRQFKQRISLGYTLKTLMDVEVPLYIAHRLKVAGSVQGLKLFSDKALSLIAHYSKGIPRIINSLCDNALLTGYALEKHQIDEDLVREAAEDLMLEDMPELHHYPDKSLIKDHPHKSRVPRAREQISTRRRKVLALVFAIVILISFALSQLKWPLMDYETFFSDLITQTKDAGKKLFNEKHSDSETVAASLGNVKEIIDNKEQEPASLTAEEATIDADEEVIIDDTPSIASQQEIRADEETNLLIDDTADELDEREIKQESPLKQEDSEQNSTIRIVKIGDSMSQLLQEVYGKNSYELLSLVKIANPQIRNVNFVAQGQRITFPFLKPEAMVFKQDNSQYKAFLSATRRLSQAAQWQRQMGEQGITVTILPVKLTPSIKSYVLMSEDYKTKEQAIKTVKEASASSSIKHLKEGGYE